MILRFILSTVFFVNQSVWAAPPKSHLTEEVSQLLLNLKTVNDALGFLSEILPKGEVEEYKAYLILKKVNLNSALSKIRSTKQSIMIDEKNKIEIAEMGAVRIDGARFQYNYKMSLKENAEILSKMKSNASFHFLNLFISEANAFYFEAGAIVLIACIAAVVAGVYATIRLPAEAINYFRVSGEIECEKLSPEQVAAKIPAGYRIRVRETFLTIPYSSLINAEEGIVPHTGESKLKPCTEETLKDYKKLLKSKKDKEQYRKKVEETLKTGGS